MILFIDLMVLAVIIAIIIGFVTQVLIPLFQGTPFFPFFREKSSVAKAIDEANDTLEDIAEVEVLKETLEEIDQRKSQLKGK